MSETNCNDDQQQRVVMPCPRLELEWVMVGDDWRKRECIYSIVIPLDEHDIRRRDADGKKVRNEVKAEIGRTAVSGGNGEAPIWGDGKVQRPFRDGAHAIWDSKVLGNMPVVAVCGDVFTVGTEEA